MDQNDDLKEMFALLQGMRADIKDFKRSSGSLSSSATPNSSSNVNFNVHAEGLGFRIVVMLCVIMFVLLICSIGFSIYSAEQQNAQIQRIEQKTDRMQDYLNVILQWSPELRKQVESQGKKS
jgi:hypothetical protein